MKSLQVGSSRPDSEPLAGRRVTCITSSDQVKTFFRQSGQTGDYPSIVEEQHHCLEFLIGEGLDFERVETLWRNFGAHLDLSVPVRRPPRFETSSHHQAKTSSDPPTSPQRV